MSLPDFYLSSVTVRGFRAARDLALELTPDLPVAILGPNNSGKTCLLDAISLCLGSPKASQYEVTDDDFWHAGSGESAEEWAVDVGLAARPGGVLPAVKPGVGDPIDVAGIRIVGERGETKFQRLLLDVDGNPILLSKSPVSKDKKELYRGMGLRGRSYATFREIQQWMPTVWHLEPDSLHASLYLWKSGPLQRILAAYKEDLFTAQWTTQSGRPMPESLDKAQQFLAEQALPTPFWTEKIVTGLKQKFQDYLGRQGRINLSPELSPIEEWLLSELRLQVTPGAGLASVDSRRLGQGWQSLLRLAALELVVDLSLSQGKTGKAVLLIEEPESYLHPHLRRRMRGLFARLQTAGHQCLFSTHSPELISFADPQQIVRLHLTPEGVQKSVYASASAKQAVKDEEKLHEGGNHEMLFANLVILTEGKSDEFAIRLGLDGCTLPEDSNHATPFKLDRDALSVSVVNCGSVNNLPAYAEICSKLGIPWIAVHDRDRLSDGSIKVNTAAAHAALVDLRSEVDAVIEWDNDLEEVLACPQKASPSWIYEHYGTVAWSDLASNGELERYVAVIRTILTLARDVL